MKAEKIVQSFFTIFFAFYIVTLDEIRLIFFNFVLLHGFFRNAVVADTGSEQMTAKMGIMKDSDRNGRAI